MTTHADRLNSRGVRRESRYISGGHIKKRRVVMCYLKKTLFGPLEPEIEN
jgi:hypothetical protein